MLGVVTLSSQRLDPFGAMIVCSRVVGENTHPWIRGGGEGVLVFVNQMTQRATTDTTQFGAYALAGYLTCTSQHKT
jgi:hypothetical protein